MVNRTLCLYELSAYPKGPSVFNRAHPSQADFDAFLTVPMKILIKLSKDLLTGKPFSLKIAAYDLCVLRQAQSMDIPILD